MNEFETKVLGGVESLAEQIKTIKTHREQMLADVTRLDETTKKAITDIGQVKDVVNGQAEVLNQIKKAQVLLRREELTHFGDPIKRFAADEFNRTWLQACMLKALDRPLSAEQRTAVTGVDSGIGAAVTPQATNNAIYDALLTYGQWSTLGVIPVGAKTEIIPLITVRPTAYWVAQGAAITEGAFTGTSVTLTIKEAAAWIPVARGLIDDSSVDMVSWIMEQLGQSVAYRLDWACFAADGTNDSTDGAYTGIASGGTAADAAAGNTTVAALELDDFVRCLTTVDAGILSRPCGWWIHPQILAKICLIRDGNNRPIFQNAVEAPSPGAIGSILGYPVVLTSAMPSTDSASGVIAVFGDPQGMAVGVRKAFEFARSDEFQFDYNRSCFRGIVRAGCIIKNATSFAKLTLAAA